MFGLVILVFFILNQVDFRKAMDCSSVAYSEEPCNITREVSLNQGTLVWRKDTAFILLTNHPCTSQTNGNFSGYCFDKSLNRFYILEILHPEYHDQSIFTDSVTTDKTTLDLMVPDNLSSTDLTLLIPDKIDGDKIIMSASIDCCKPMPTFNWSLVVLDSNTRYVFENSTMTSDNSCSPRLLKWNSSLTVDLNALDPTIIEQGKDISIKIDVNFGCCKTVSSVPVTVTNIGSTSSTSATTQDNFPSTTVGSTVEPHILCGCCYSLVLLIITAVLVVVFVILVIVHLCRRDAKKEGNVYWVINVVLILIGIMCLILSIIQILYLGCVIACTDLSLCSDKTGHDASIAFIVFGFIVFVICIVLFVIRYKQRDQSKETNNTNPGKETNGTERTSHGTNHTNPGQETNRTERTSHGTNHTNPGKETNRTERTSHGTNHTNPGNETNRTERTSHGTNNTNLEKETNGTERTSHGTNHTNPGKETNRAERTSHGTNNTNPGKETNGKERTSQETNNAYLEKETNGTEKTKNRTSIRLLPIPKNS